MMCVPDFAPQYAMAVQMFQVLRAAVSVDIDAES